MRLPRLVVGCVNEGVFCRQYFEVDFKNDYANSRIILIKKAGDIIVRPATSKELFFAEAMHNQMHFEHGGIKEKDRIQYLRINYKVDIPMSSVLEYVSEGHFDECFVRRRGKLFEALKAEQRRMSWEN